MAEILLEVTDRVATITLNRPEKLNAFTNSMLDAWCAAYAEAQARDDVYVIVVTGAGRGFCSGGDVSAMGDHAETSPLEIKNRIWHTIASLAKAVARIDKPVIAAVNGVAAGGGLDAAIMCDIVLAAESARFAETYARLGLIPGAGGAYFLPRRIGRARALDMLWTADWIDAREALRIGLADHVFADAEFAAKVRAYAQKIADAAPLSVRLIKRTVDASLNCDLETSLDLISSHMTVVRSSADHREAVAAFREKRKPRFEGR